MKMTIIADRYGNVVATGDTTGTGDGAPSQGGPSTPEDRFMVEVDLPDDFAEHGIDRLHYRFQLRLGDKPELVDLERVGGPTSKDPQRDGVYPARLVRDNT